MIEDIFYHTINEKTHGIYKQRAFSHSYSVSSLMQLLANSYHLDPYLCKIIGLYHDIAQYVNCNSFNHAKLSSDMTYRLLKDYLSDYDLDIVCKAIANHSDKDHIHDVYSELLKDADVLASYFDGHTLSEKHNLRIKKYIEKGLFNS